MTVNAVLDMPKITAGRLGLVSQSGSLIGAILSRGEARGIGFSALVSIGNEGDLSVGDVADMLVDDDHTDAILLFLETIREAPRLARACRRAAGVGKPVIAYVLGQSELGRELAATHTGALAGSAEAMAAWLDAQGVVRVDQFETLLEIPPLLRQARPPGARRVAVVTTTGGGAAMVVDRIGSDDVRVVGPPPEVIAQLAAQGIRIGAGPVTDLTLAGTRREVYAAVLDAYLASDHCDTVLAVAGSSAQFHPQHVVEPIVAAERRGKWLAAFAAPQADAALALFARAGVPAFRTPEACADALRALARWREPQDAAPADRATRSPRSASASALARALRGGIVRRGAGALGVRDARRAAGRLARHRRRRRSRSAAGAGGGQGAVAGHPAQVRRRRRAPGLRDARREARTAFGEVLAAARRAMPRSRIRGALVQRMETGLGKSSSDSVTIRRRARRSSSAPAARSRRSIATSSCGPHRSRSDEAARMVDAVRGLAPLRGYRGAAAGDLAALCRAVRRFSLLACVEGVRILEAEINPLLVRAAGSGVVALDGVLVTAPRESA